MLIAIFERKPSQTNMLGYNFKYIKSKKILRCLAFVQHRHTAVRLWRRLSHIFKVYMRPSSGLLKA